MRPTAARSLTQAVGIHPLRSKPKVESYKSPFAPKYTVPLHVGGVDAKYLTKFGLTAAFWGVVAGAGALMFFSEVPRVKKDIMQKLPGIGEMFHKEVPASDNPF